MTHNETCLFYFYLFVCCDTQHNSSITNQYRNKMFSFRLVFPIKSYIEMDLNRITELINNNFVPLLPLASNPSEFFTNHKNLSCVKFLQ